MKRGVLRTGDGGRLLFRCPGCNEAHQVQVGDGPGPRWGFNGDYARPTFTPSVLLKTGHYCAGQEGKDCWCTYEARIGKPSPFKCTVCHSFVTDGRIQFLNDCTHALAGQTVPLPDFEV
ncbi:Ammonia monooxygenase [Aminobacter aminovorans]|uniref:Ammonia monooxygenase n=1 Tax=Aminobacter aminovorans TaxID=83263 RepID=A0AAC9FDI9_AMIAI|nr:DUF6527 family protein [Aminobacter aminovorans]AMS41145.1 Ammonia monooxygenase [Aminobacter aminovorans]